MTRQMMAVAGAVMVAFAGVVAYATAAGDTPTKIEACRNLRHGLVRIVLDSSGCKSNEVPLAWDMQGTPGLAGPEGPEGPAGTRRACGAEGRARWGSRLGRCARRHGLYDVRRRAGPDRRRLDGDGSDHADL